MSKFSVEIECQLDPNVDVVLDVGIGYEQIGGSIVKLGQEEIAQGTISDQDLGSSDDLRGKQLVVRTTVADINDNTDKTIVHYEIKSGDSSTKFLTRGSVDSPGNGVVHQAVVSFV